MHIKNHLFPFCLLGTVVLTTGVVFFPRYISRSLDMREINQVEVSKREDFSFLEQGSNDLIEAVHAFRYLEQGGENPTLIASIKEPIQINSDLMQEVYIQAMTASEFGMLPWIAPLYTDVSTRYKPSYAAETYTDKQSDKNLSAWTISMKSARYYTLTYESEENPNKKELLNFWYLRFSDDTSFDYSFIVNAVTYQIYYAEIHNVSSNGYVETVEELEGHTGEEIDEYSSDFFAYYGQEFAQGCALYYQPEEYDYVGKKNLYRKLNLAILYFEDEKPLYVEQSIADNENEHMYKGIRVGFQDLVNWVQFLPDE